MENTVRLNLKEYENLKDELLKAKEVIKKLEDETLILRQSKTIIYINHLKNDTVEITNEVNVLKQYADKKLSDKILGLKTDYELLSNSYELSQENGGRILKDYKKLLEVNDELFKNLELEKKKTWFSKLIGK